MLNRCLRISVVILTWTTLLTSEVWACPMCKFAVEADDPKPRAYMYSILFMLGAMFTVVGSVVGLLVWLNKTERAALNAAGYQHLFENAVTQSLEQPLPTR